jgi:hypothetical protein
MLDGHEPPSGSGKHGIRHAQPRVEYCRVSAAGHPGAAVRNDVRAGLPVRRQARGGEVRHLSSGWPTDRTPDEAEEALMSVVSRVVTAAGLLLFFAALIAVKWSIVRHDKNAPSMGHFVIQSVTILIVCSVVLAFWS